MTAVIVAFLTLPLAALRPFQQPAQAAARDEFPESFKISILPVTTGSTAVVTDAAADGANSTTSTTAKTTTATKTSVLPANPTQATAWSCDSYSGKSTSTHINVNDSGSGQIIQYMQTDGDHCSEATVVGPAKFSADETRLAERVARLRAQGGVPAVLKEIKEIRGSSAKRAHYEALLKGPPMSPEDAEKVTIQAGDELVGSSGDLSAIIQKLPRSSMHSGPARRAVSTALSRINSSGDKANTLEYLAPNADPELLLILGEAAEELPSSGDKANFLIATAAEYLTPGNAALRSVYFHTTSTLQSSGDMANVLMAATPYGHADPQIALAVVETSKGMASSGDRANVLISIANANLLTTRELKDAFMKAALALPSDGDRANVLASAARGQ